MSYQVLARKWRPQNFKQMVGQEHVLKALIHALESQRLHHAYLFTGTRGVGKTTIGRILAKCLSCHTGITAEPCGQCGACTSITEGRYVDLIEIDAASRTKVEDMREILDNVQYAASEGRFKIYLIDEVHMLSQSSFNALLKTLEEPPEHVKFLFATTDPQKLPVTILSRCLQFNLKNMPPERIVGHLQYILSEESVSAEEAALWALARAADGSMRDALSLTDQAIAYGNSQLTEEGVSAMLGTVDQKKIYRILDALIGQDASGVLQEVKALAEFSPDYASVLATLISILHRVAVEQAVPGVTDNAMGDKEQIMTYARQLCAEDVQLFYQIALVSRKDLAISPDPQAGIEMALLRMMAFQLSPSNQTEKPVLASQTALGQIEPPVAEDVVTREKVPSEGASDLPNQGVELDVPPAMDVPPIESYGQEPAYEASASDEYDAGPALQQETVEDPEGKKKTPLVDGEASPLVDGEASPSINQEASPVVNTETSASRHAESSPQVNAESSPPDNEASPQNNVETSPPENVGETLTSKVAAPAAAPEVIPASDPVKASTGSAPESVRAEDAWPKKASEVEVTGMTQNLLLNMALVEEEGALKLYVESGHYRLLNRSHEERIEKAMKAKFGADKKLILMDGLMEGQETPMMWRDRRKAEMLAQAKQNIQTDPNVQKLIEMFDARIIEESIQALGAIT